MTRLIDADELKKRIELEEGIFWDSYSSDELVISKKYIEDAPTVEERPHGKWITVYFSREELNVPQKASVFDFVKCPFCETIHQGRHHFCSWCGADMRGE